MIIISTITLILIGKQEKEDDKKKYETEKLKIEYPLVGFSQESHSKKIEGVIINKKLDMGSFNKGALYLTLDNGENFSISYVTRNYMYDPYELVDLLQVADSIFKPANSYLFYVFRSEEKYTFMLGCTINNKPHNGNVSD